MTQTQEVICQCQAIMGGFTGLRREKSGWIEVITMQKSCVNRSSQKDFIGSKVTNQQMLGMTRIQKGFYCMGYKDGHRGSCNLSSVAVVALRQRRYPGSSC